MVGKVVGLIYEGYIFSVKWFRSYFGSRICDWVESLLLRTRSSRNSNARENSPSCNKESRSAEINDEVSERGCDDGRRCGDEQG